MARPVLCSASSGCGRKKLVEFICGTGWTDVPAGARARICVLLRDFAAVALAGRRTHTAWLAAEFASDQLPGDQATALLDGRRLATGGAAWANGVLANALDFDDGHRLVKGHPGANVIPAALAVAEMVDAALEDFLAAVAVGYEVAIRAGIDLHRRSVDYHASGAWGALGAAAAAARLLSLEEFRVAHALGLAEYHAPIAPVMRSIAEPQMTKDACGWGALLGTWAALLARGGFTSVASVFPTNGTTDDLGNEWHVLDVYVKKFPCCRWSHPAIEGAIRLRQKRGVEPADIARIRIRTFAAAAALARGVPETTEEAQYSLVWPVGVALSRGSFGPEYVLEPIPADPRARELARGVEVSVGRSFDRVFPGRRVAEVRVHTRRGASWASTVKEVPGDPEDSSWAEIVEAKFRAFADAIATPRMASEASLGRRNLDELLSIITSRPEPYG